VSALSGRTPLSSLTTNRPHPIIRDVQADNAQFPPEDIIFTTIADCGFKAALFDRLTFRFVSFKRCYFRDALFNRVKFEGCRFIDCTFHGAILTNCSLDYSEFTNCNVTFGQVRNCWPAWDNVRLPLARNLKTNALNRGDTDDARAFLLVELRALRQVNFGKAFLWTDPYYKKFTFTQRLVGLGTVVWLMFSEIVWGHGERLLRIGAVSGVLVTLFAWLYSLPGMQLSFDLRRPTWSDYLDYSLSSFTNSGLARWQPVGTLTVWVTHAEGVLGLVLFGFLVAAVFRRISRR
jgi:hypothetical protein